MRQTTAYPFGRRLRLAAGAAGFVLFLASSVSAQLAATTGPCTVQTLRMRITTAGDDLRGGKDNLNVTIRWGDHGFQGAPNVNNGANWPNGSVHVVDIRLNQPVPLNEIRSISLDHLAGGGLTVSAETVLSPIGVLAGLQSDDNWDMASLEVSAVGNGVGDVIVRHGPKRFTGSDPVLNIRVGAPAGACGSGAGNNTALAGSGAPGAGSGALLNPKTPASVSPVAAAGRPAAKLTPQQLAAIFAKLHAAKGKLAPVVSNPAAGQGSGSVLALLQQQKQVALAERSQSSPPPPAPSSTMQRAALAPMAGRGVLATAAAPAPSTPMNRLMTVTPSTATASCAALHGPSIATVSGQQGSSAVFTQDPQYNLFTIRGCNFGQNKGQGQLNSANGRKLTDLTIDSWTDTLITAEVPSTLTGALDQENVSLLLFPGNGPQVQKSGFHFSAQRAEIHLASIPASQATLATIADSGGSPVQATLSSPYTVGAAALSGGVDRNSVARFSGGTDVFSFARLKPGFTVEKFQVNELSNASCNDLGPTTTTTYTDGNWNWQLSGSTIRVSWEEQHCHDAYFGDASDAGYGLDVWLSGPVLGPGDSPWQDGVN